jgi:hypothetical protein
MTEVCGGGLGSAQVTKIRKPDPGRTLRVGLARSAWKNLWPDCRCAGGRLRARSAAEKCYAQAAERPPTRPSSVRVSPPGPGSRSGPISARRRPGSGLVCNPCVRGVLRGGGVVQGRGSTRQGEGPHADVLGVEPASRVAGMCPSHAHSLLPPSILSLAQSSSHGPCTGCISAYARSSTYSHYTLTSLPPPLHFREFQPVLHGLHCFVSHHQRFPCLLIFQASTKASVLPLSVLRNILSEEGSVEWGWTNVHTYCPLCI